MKLGVCWYPEQHPEDCWADDVRRMVDAGLQLVRLGEFAWGRLEPARGRFDTDWMSRAVDLAAAAGLGVVIGTPSAAPPRWLVQAHPEVRLQDADGGPRAPGSRRATCPTAPAYRNAVRAVVEVIVDHFGEHPGVVAWQIDNEPGNHDSARCWCRACEAAFRAWVQARYGTLERLNEAWGTVFWSGQYGDWREVELPRPSSTVQSPSLRLAHQRFASAQILSAIAEQHAIVTAGSPGRDVMVNEYFGDTFIDDRAIHRLTGVTAIDAYPHGVLGPEWVGFLLDRARTATGRDGRAWVMEQQAGPINWTEENPPVPPGAVRVWAWQAAMHGIEAALFFSWRPTRSGQEQYHSGLLRHDGTPDRGLVEVTALAAELRETLAADPAIVARPRARVAVLDSIEDTWAIEIDPHRAGLHHRLLVQAAHAATRRLGLECDVIDPDDDLAGYQLILAPALQLVMPTRLARLQAALAAGSTVVLGPRSLVKDADDCWLETPLPGGLAEVLGGRVIEGLSQTLDVSVEPGEAPAGIWVDVLEVDPDASPAPEILARYSGASHLAGDVAAMRRGGLVYLGASSVEAWTDLVERLASEVGLLTLPRLPAASETERFVRGDRVVTLDHGSWTLRIEPAIF